MAELFPAATGTSLLDSAAKEVLAVAGTAVAASETGPRGPAADRRAGATISPDLLRRLPRPGLLSALSPTLRTALGALRRNKLRSALTTLGVIIGVGAVIAMMEIGARLEGGPQATIASMGANTIMVQSGGGGQRRRELRHGVHAHAHAAGRRADPPPMPGGSQHGAAGQRPARR